MMNRKGYFSSKDDESINTKKTKHASNKQSNLASPSSGLNRFINV